jgi:hypothetical protein
MAWNEDRPWLGDEPSARPDPTLRPVPVGVAIFWAVFAPVVVYAMTRPGGPEVHWVFLGLLLGVSLGILGGATIAGDSEREPPARR